MRIVILGSTGSIGTQTLELLKDHPEHQVIGLSVGKNIALLEEQIRVWKPKYLAVYEEEQAVLLRKRLEENKETDYSPLVLSGMEGLVTLSALPEAEMIVVSVVGMVGIQPTIRAIQEGKKLALANKETLVCAGHLIQDLLKDSKAKLYPVDSEHSAIWQCLRGEDRREVSKIILTASGGPFFGMKKADMMKMKKEDALQHPNWSMGNKITIDSASMVNKALEVIEAHVLFSVPIEKIQVVIQRESIVHSAVEFQDGAMKAELGVPTMRIPIAYALFEEEREQYKGEKLDFSKMMTLHFYPPSYEDFPALRLGREAGMRGGSMTTVFNAANEEAVRLFLEDRIPFLAIPVLIEKAMHAHEESWIRHPEVEEILEVEKWSRAFVLSEADKGVFILD